MVEPHLVNLLVKLAVAASLASILVRFEVFKRSLLREDRSVIERLLLAGSISALFGGAAATRVATTTYVAADVGLEGCLIAGLVGGYVTGLVSGVAISLPAMVNGEYLAMPLFAAVGVLGGLVRDAAPDAEEIWRISPFPDLSLYRALRNWSDHKRTLFYLFFQGVILSLEGLRFLGNQFGDGRFLFALYPTWANPHPAHYVLVWVTTLLAVTLPIKIWSNARTERKLEAQQRLLQEARLRALMSQINPHFLFNTLNSISSLVRTNPDTARGVIVKLSSILRRLMRKQDNVGTLREELAFIDDYLSIEMVRFGDKLRFEKEVAAEALECTVPSMLLQPIVENSLKHGLSSKVEGGTIKLKVWISAGRLQLVIEDDGVGIPDSDLESLFDKGIGVSNVNERLKVLYGGDYKMWIDSKLGEGTRTGIEIPERRAGLAKAS